MRTRTLFAVAKIAECALRSASYFAWLHRLVAEQARRKSENKRASVLVLCRDEDMILGTTYA